MKGIFEENQIGGTDSFMRRLTSALLEIDKNLIIEWIFYNSAEEKEVYHHDRFVLKYFKTFNELLNYINLRKPEHVICTWIKPKDRIKFAVFRKNHPEIKFHNLVFFYPESPLKRFFKFLEFLLFPYNGKVFCVSNRQYKYLRRICKNVVYILPPVPREYFLSPEEKPVNEKIKVTFLGRIDPRKGIKEVIEIFRTLKGNPKFEFEIYGIHIPQDRDAFNIHNWLKSQNEIKYVELNRQAYSPEVEEMVKKILKTTDILIQPYKNLDSTVDTPLLLLEAMASLCIFLTTSVGDIQDIYGIENFVIPPDQFIQKALKLLQVINYSLIIKERERLFKRINEIECESFVVSQNFWGNLE
jgi:glycosyltransferase involved in cell wall biosynthesis